MIKRNTKKGEKPGIIAQVSFARKKFRFSDWFAERFIKAVAFMSIAFVTLIFIFVFREAFPVFRMNVVQNAATETLV